MVKDKVLVSPRIFTFTTAWLKTRWRFAFKERETLRSEGYLASLNAVYVIESTWHDRSIANVFLWVEDMESIAFAMDAVLTITKNIGFSRACLYVDENLYSNLIANWRHRVLSIESLLIKNIAV